MLIKLILSSFRFMLTLGLGGGGGGGGDTGGNDALWDAQAAQAKQSTAMSGEIFDYWQKYAPQYLNNANTMTQEAMDGTLTDRMRSQASADADSASASNMAAANRSLDRHGATLNTNALASQTKAAALQGAATKSDAMNKAQQWGENQKWARNQDAYGLVSGMPGNAVSAANTAQSSMNGMASMQNSSNAVAAQNASGYGQFGATVASSMFKADGGLARAVAYANGGCVKARHSTAVRLAAGGMPSNPVKGWRERVADMPTIGQSSSGSANPVMSTLSGALPTVAAKMAEPYLKQAGSSIKDAVANGIGEARNGIEQALGVDQTQPAAELIDKSTMVADAAETAVADAGTTAATEAATTAAADTAATAATEAAATTAATTAAETAAATAASTAATGAATTAATGAVAANAWNPVGWIGGLALALSAANRKADGGAIHGEPTERADLTPGGPVTGPGSETSDSIPAWLSNAEYVLNAEAVKLPVEQTEKIVTGWQREGGSTQDLIEGLNTAGLKRRHGNQAVMVDGEAKPNGLAAGGMLGIALGTGAQTFNQLQQQGELNRMRDEQMQLSRNADARAEKQNALQLEAEQMKVDEYKGAKKILDQTKAEQAAIWGGDLTPIIDRYNRDVDDGHTAKLASGENGAQVIRLFNQAGEMVQENPVGRKEIEQAAKLHEQVMRDQLRFTSPTFYQAAMAADQKAEQQAADRLEKERERADKFQIAAGNNATSLEVARIRKSDVGGRSGSGGGSSGGSKAETVADSDNIDLQKIGGNLKVFGDDPVANVELASVARNKFLPHVVGTDQGRGEEALRAAFAYRQRKDEAVKALQEEKGEDYRPTEEELDNLVAPVGIDMATGQAVRKFSVNQSDPSSSSFALGKPVSPAAPLPVQQITFGKSAGLPAMITAIKAGQLGDDDKAAWDRMLNAKLSNLPEEQRAAVMQQWGADGLVRHVTKYVKPTVTAAGKPAETGKPGAAGLLAAKAVAERAPEDVAAFGARPKGLGEAVSSAANWIKQGVVDPVMAASERNNLRAMNKLRLSNSLDDTAVARFKELLLKYPDVAEEIGFQRGTTQLAERADGKIAAR